MPTTYPLGLASPENITVTGRWEYWDNNENIQSLVWARVLIYDLEPGNVLDYKGYATTDINGYFTSAPIPNDDGPGEDGLDIVVCITAWNPGIAVVIDSEGHTHAGLTSVYNDCPDGTLDIGTWRVPHNTRGAWMIFSYHCGVAAGWDYLNSTVDYETPTVTACWPCGDWPGYYYNETTGVTIIFLPNWACSWPDVILHEYGHHVMYSLYGYIPPSMLEHYLKEQSNSTTAWAEGWADFFPLVVFNDPVFTLANATHYLPINLEEPTWFWSDQGWEDGDEVEGRVAGALWDIFDSVDEHSDWFSDGFLRIWNVTSTTPRNTFADFWDAWNASDYPKQPALMAIFQNTIDYRGPGDVDGDGVVQTVYDGMYIARAIGTTKDYKPWGWDWNQYNPAADLDHNGEVWIMDYIIYGMNHGNEYDC